MNKYIGLTAHIVRAYTANNTIPAAALPELITDVHNALTRITTPGSERRVAVPPRSKPKKTVFPGYLVSLEDGKKYKSLRRHLGKFGLTPDEYRAKWDLPPTYPMVAADYSEERSALARKMGLGRKKGAKVIPLRGKGGPAKVATKTPAKKPPAHR